MGPRVAWGHWWRTWVISRMDITLSRAFCSRS